MPREPKCTVYGHEHEKASNCRACAADRLVTHGRRATYASRDLPPAPEPHGRDLAAGKD